MMITHDEYAADYATRKVRMFDGEVVDDGLGGGAETNA